MVHMYIIYTNIIHIVCRDSYRILRWGGIPGFPPLYESLVYIHTYIRTYIHTYYTVVNIE